MVFEPLLPNGEIILMHEKPSSLVYSPQGLVYKDNFLSRIVEIKAKDTTNAAYLVKIQRPNGFFITYSFSVYTAGGQTKSDIGAPTGDQTSFYSKLVAKDTNGANCNVLTPKASGTGYDFVAPAYYDRILGNGSVVRLSGSTKEVVSITSPKGETLYSTSNGIGLEVIHDADGILRQVKSDADGLADIVVIGEFKYEIRLYAPGNVGTKNVEGLYEPSGDPRAVWRVENPQFSHDKVNKILITEIKSGVERTYNWDYIEASDEWRVNYGDGLRTKTKSKVWDDSRKNQLITTETRDSSGNAVYKEISINHTYAWGSAINKYVIDPDGVAATYVYDYYTDASQPGKYSQIKSVLKADGSWIAYDYDANKRIISERSSSLDAPFNSSASQAKVIYYFYSPVDPDDIPDTLTADHRPRTVTETILGITTKKTYYAFKLVNNQSVVIEEQCASPTSIYGSASNLRTTTTYYTVNTGLASSGKVQSVGFPDGRLDSYSYEYGRYAAAPAPADCAFTLDSSGTAVRTAITHGTTSSPSGIANRSTKETTIIDSRGDTVINETYIYTGTGFERIAWKVIVYDDLHHVTASYNSNNEISETSWNCCAKESETAPDGTCYLYSYDVLDRIASKTKVGAAGQSDIVTAYEYDGNDHIIAETVSAGTLSLATATTYDMLSRKTRQTDPAGLTTTYSYSDSGRTETVMLPGGATRITRKHLDGSLDGVIGSSVVAQYYEYGINADGSTWTKSHNAYANSPSWVKTTSDLLGRTVKTEKPTFNGSVTSAQFFFNSKNQLERTSQSGIADTLYEYDELGQEIRSGLDVNSNGSLDLASMDRISDNATTYQKSDGAWWQVITSAVYAVDNASTPTITGITRNQLTDLSANVTSKTVSFDIHGNRTESWTVIDHASKTKTNYVNPPDSMIDMMDVFVNGLQTMRRDKTNATITYGYDALGYPIQMSTQRTGEFHIHYDAARRIDYVQNAAGNQVSFGYDPNTGRRIWTEDALGKRIKISYNDRGQELKRWGVTVYPVEYIYDDYGRKIQMHTYRGGSGWEQASWPSNGTPENTTWNYHEATGLLLRKYYDDGKGASYTYNTTGKLVSRTWARMVSGQALVTTYSYDASTGEITAVDYSDTTPDIGYTYDRLGQKKTVTDALGIRTFAYNNKLKLESETIAGLYAKTIIRHYSDTGMIGLDTGFSIDTGYTVAYAYDAYGRFTSITSDTDVFEYGYLANSNAVASVRRSNNIVTDITYESNRDLIAAIENKFGSTIISKYNYTNDALERRSAIEKTGAAFDIIDSITYGYNDRNEVINATAQTDTDYNFTYTYDNIGNRLAHASADTFANYQSNELNQYAQIVTGGQTDTPLYDEDGNMLSNDGWSYTWDGENHLVKIENESTVICCIYDFMSRRVEKQVFSRNIGGWSLNKAERYVYDGWNLVEVLDVTNLNAMTQVYVWGLDLSMSLQGAGGVGGLLSGTIEGSKQFYFFDASGNASQLLDQNGNIVAQYEHSPFGKIVSMRGDFCEMNPYRFSGKYLDVETGLVYYGHRFFSSNLGRWLSRDPITERGGFNLYAFCLNSPMDLYDVNGNTSGICDKFSTDIFNACMIGHAADPTSCRFKNCKEIGAAAWIACYNNTNDTSEALKEAMEAIRRLDELGNSKSLFLMFMGLIFIACLACATFRSRMYAKFKECQD